MYAKNLEGGALSNMACIFFSSSDSNSLKLGLSSSQDTRNIQYNSISVQFLFSFPWYLSFWY